MKRIIIFGFVLTVALITVCFPIANTSDSEYASTQSIVSTELTEPFKESEIISLDEASEADKKVTALTESPSANPIVSPSPHPSSTPAPTAPHIKPSATNPSVSQTKPSQTAPPFSWDRGGNHTGPINIREASASGLQTKATEKAILDYSNTNDGYVMAKKLSGEDGYICITGPRDMNDQRLYHMKKNDCFYPIPLHGGNGEYKVDITIHFVKDGNRRTSSLSQDLSVRLRESEIHYLFPNIYVNYNGTSAIVKKSFDLCVNAKNDLEKVQSIYGYITKNITYLLTREKETPGYIPHLDSVLAAKKGSCFDYATLMTGMCRAQGIKTRLVFGNVLGGFHAWVEVYIPHAGLIAEGIPSNSGWKRLDPTFGATMKPEKIESLRYDKHTVH